jgi:hypothetical protein
MPPKNKVLTVYPDPLGLAIVGGNAPAINRAVECWARKLREIEPTVDLSRQEWNFLADVLNGTMSDNAWNGSWLAQEAHDAQSLNGTGDRWFGEDGQRGSGDEAARALVEKLAAMSWDQAQYVLAATAFFWSKAGIDVINHDQHEWWTIRFRIDTLRDRSNEDE